MPSPAKPAPRVVIFAGPNGAGKSTHADAILAALGIETFVNADYIARGLSGRNTDAVAFEAGRIMLTRLRQLGEAKVDFAFESTLSSRTFASFLRALKQQGYAVAIYYFSLENAQLAVRRVKLRVAQGGHHVPIEVVRRRFGRSLNNFFNLYMPLADEWTLFDNSDTPPRSGHCGEVRRPTHSDGTYNMAQTKQTQQNRLTPTPKALQKALEQSAKQAQKMADAFGLVVPYGKPKATSRTHTAN